MKTISNLRILYCVMAAIFTFSVSAQDAALHLDFIGSDGIKMEGTGTGDARIWMINGGGTHYIFDDNSDGHSFDFQSANDMNFMTNGTNERLTILESGLIGMNGDPYSLAQATVTNTANQFGFRSNTSGSGARTAVSGITESTSGSFFKTGVAGSVTGSLGTGAYYGVHGSASTVGTNRWAVYSNGDLHYTGSFTGPSDKKLKTNIQDIPSVLDKVMELKVKTYDYDKEKYAYMNLADGKQIGFLAQDVQALFPELVEETSHVGNIDNAKTEDDLVITEFKALNKIDMIPILAKAIQEQQEIIEQLQSQVEQVVSKNQALTSQLQSIEK